jgi:hypothetical protein
MIYYFAAQRHTHALQSFLGSWGKSLASRIKLLTYESILADPGSVPRRDGAYIFTNLNTIHRMRPQARAIVVDLHRRLVDECGARKVLNDPTQSLRRYDILRLLHEQGINTFKTYRLTESLAALHFPAFIRREWGTEYEPPRLLNNAAEFETAVQDHRSRLGSLAGLLAVEFCNTADATGVFRKYGAFVIGDRIVPRHLFFSRDWLVKVADLAEPPMLAEEMTLMQSNPHADVLLRCTRLSRIGYGRVDYAFLDGRPQIWEINTNAMLASGISAAIPARRPVHLKFVALIGEAFAALEEG